MSTGEWFSKRITAAWPIMPCGRSIWIRTAFSTSLPVMRTAIPSGWSDPGYASELETANAVLSRPERLKRLAGCEKRLLVGNAVPALLSCCLELSLQAIRPRTGQPSIRRARVSIRLDRHELETAMTPTLAKASTEPLRPTAGLWHDAWVRFRRNRMALAAGLVVLIIVVFARRSVAGVPLQRLRVRHARAR